MSFTSWYRVTDKAGSITALSLDSRLAARESARGAAIVLADEADLIALAGRRGRRLIIRRRLSPGEREHYFRAPNRDASVYALAW